MAAKSKNPVAVPIQAVLSPDSFAFLEKSAKGGDIAATLAGWVAYWMDNQSRGGLMMSPEDHDYVATLNEGKRFRDSRGLVAAVEKGLKRDAGQYSFTINVDPAHVQPLKEQAALSAMTVEELINGAVNMLMTNGWLWDFSPANGRHIPFTAEMLKSCAVVCEKQNVDSSDIAGMIAEDRLMPITREVKAQAKELIDKVDFNSADVAALMEELKRARVELKSLRSAPREMVAA